MKLLVQLKDLSFKDSHSMGSKACSMAYLLQNIENAPDAFVLKAEALYEVIKKNKKEKEIELLIPELENCKTEKISTISKKLQQEILNLSFNNELQQEILKSMNSLSTPFYCIRSSSSYEDSANNAWSGILESYINIQNLKEVEHSIKKCWSSLFSARAILYAKNLNIKISNLKTAVIIQEFIESYKSGVSFSIDPVKNNKEHIIIDAIHGLGIPVTDGIITPEHYIINKKNLELVQTINNTQKKIYHPLNLGGVECLDFKGFEGPQKNILCNSEIKTLSQTVLHLESKYKHPIDIEWTFGPKGLYVLQCRPITTTPTKLELQKNSSPKQKEVIVNDSPYLFWWSDYDAMWQFDLGLQSFYINKDCKWNRLKDLIYIRHNHKTTCYISEQEKEHVYAKGQYYLDPNCIKSLESEIEDCCNNVNTLFNFIKNSTFKNATKQEEINILEKITAQYSLCISLYRSSDSFVTDYLTDQLKNKISIDVINSLIAPDLNRNILHQEQTAWNTLIKTPTNLEDLIEHVKNYPWLASNHHNLKEIEQTILLKYNSSKELQKITKEKSKTKGDSQDNNQNNSGSCDKNKDNEDKSELKKGNNTFKEKNTILENNNIIQLLKKIAEIRIKLKTTFSSFDFYLINFFSFLSEKYDEKLSDLYLYYRISDLANLINGQKLTELDKTNRKILSVGVIDQNKDKALFFENKEAKKVLPKNFHPFHDNSLTNQPKKTLTGLIANSGNITGFAKILHCNDVFKANELRSNFKKGDILISEMAQLNIMDLAYKSAAIVTDEGGVLSHAAIIAREIGVPCIVGTGNATETIKDNDLIQVDANNGQVHILKKNK